ncbi:MAG TPA: efflux RND transporter periplasmic adaptor subunit [Rhodocyclaceae bacterium]|jgi:HlyD family secretion protein
MRTLLLKRLLPALLIVVALVLAFKWLTRPKPIEVLVATVEAGAVETTVANTRAGSVTACRRAKVAPPAAGRIASLPVKKGQRVKMGELLLELWNDDLLAREKVSREQLETAKSHIIEACQLTLAAQSEANQARSLRDKGFVSEERVVRAEAQARSSQATCDSAKAGVKEAEARVSSSRADTSRTVLRAPFAGIVAEINGEVGEYLTPSPPGIPTLPAVDLIDDTCIYVSAPIDEVDAAKLKVGMKGRITLDAWRGKHFDGWVRRIAPYVLALEKQARTVEVEVEFEDPAAVQKEGNLLVGYSADIEVVTETREQTLRIPTAALMPGSKVLVLNGEGILEERKIEPGLTNWEYTEIKTGLKQGDQVVTSLDREGVKAGVRARIESKKP